MAKRQRFTKEFKLEAVRLLKQADRPAAEVALELGIRRNQLYKWRDEIEEKGEGAFRGGGRKPSNQEDELHRLRRELEQVKQERDILKKAAAYFAKTSG